MLIGSHPPRDLNNEVDHIPFRPLALCRKLRLSLSTASGLPVYRFRYTVAPVVASGPGCGVEVRDAAVRVPLAGVTLQDRLRLLGYPNAGQLVAAARVVA